MMSAPADLADQIRILASGLAAQARTAGLADVAEHLEAAARAAAAVKTKPRSD